MQSANYFCEISKNLCYCTSFHLSLRKSAEKNTALFLAKTTVTASNGESLLALALNHTGVVCLSDMMTETARQNGELVEVLPDLRQTVLQPIYAVYYRHRQLTARVALLIDFLGEYLPKQKWCVK